MNVSDAVASRYSCRAFLSTPIPEATVRDIIERAGRAPSGGNVQPWRVDALAGARLEELRALVRARPELLPRGEGAEYNIYPPNLKEPYEMRRRQVGAALYQAIGIAREDRAGRYRQYARNFEFFGAPVGLLMSIDRSMGPPQWSDLGGYIQRRSCCSRVSAAYTAAARKLGRIGTRPCTLSSSFLPNTFCSAALRLGSPMRPRRSITGARRASRLTPSLPFQVSRTSSLHNRFADAARSARVHRFATKFPPMPASRLLLAFIALGPSAVPALAAGPPPPEACLNKAEQNAAVAEQKAIPLAKAMRNRREKGHHAELVRARLCRHDDRLVYVLTLLGPSGRVFSETVDAANGEVISGR